MPIEQFMLEAGTLRGMLNKAGIMELRELGAQIGVSSATTFDKEDLVNRLVEKFCAQKRPMRGKYYEATDYDAHEIMKVITENIDVKTKEVEGIIDYYEYGGMLRQPDDLESGKYEVFMPMWVMEKFDLRPGDYVLGEAFNLSSCSVMGFFKPALVNGQEPNYPRRRFEELKCIAPKNKIKLKMKGSLETIDSYTPLAEGMRSVWKTDVNGNTLSISMATLASTIKAQGFKVYSVYLGEAPEIKNILADKIEENLYYSTYDSDVSDNFRKVKIIFDMAKREVEAGQRIVIVISRAESIFSNQNQDKLRSLFGSARFLSKGGSLTVIICERKDFLLDDIADNINIISSMNGNMFFDYMKSYSSFNENKK